MGLDVRRRLLAMKYVRFEQEYLYSLPLEHFMEATSQSKQREITLASLALVHADRPSNAQPDSCARGSDAVLHASRLVA